MIGNQSNFTASLNIFLQKVWVSSSSKNTFNAYWDNLIKKDPQLQNIFVVFDIIWGGKKRQLLSTHPITAVSSSTSKVYNYLPLIQSDIEVSSEYDIGDANPSQRTLNFTVDGRTINPLEMILNGDSVAGFGEIALINDGGDYDNRFVIMKGDMDGGVSFGVKEETMSATLIDPAYTSDKITPSVIATKETIPTLPDNYVGKRYPLIFSSYPYVPCIPVSEAPYAPSWIVCSGDCVVKRVYINGNYRPPNDPNRGHSIIRSTDSKNNPITIIKFVNSNPPWESSDAVYAEVTITSEENMDLMSIIRRIIIKSSLLNEVSLDERLFFRAQTKLQKFYPKCLINGSGSGNTTRALEYIQNGLLSSFPMISMTFTGNGYGPIVTDRRSEVVVMNLVARQGLLYDRVSDIQESAKNSVRNSFTFRYNYNAVTDNYNSIIVRDSSNSPLCKISEDLYGRHDGDVIESVVIFDDKTANAVVDWMVSHESLPSYYVEYTGSPSLYFKLMLGDNVYFTDEKLGIYNQKSTITKISYKKENVVIGLKMWILYTNLGVSTAYGGGSGIAPINNEKQDTTGG